ncbi:MAG: TIM-barrel domain-containing protein [Candidatus Cryptobacteroides sp.]
MKKIALMTSALMMLGISAMEAEEYNPKANPEATVICGNARFTVLTPKLLRMEWSENGQFEDRATLAIVNRCLEVPPFKTAKKGKGVSITTSELKLTYTGEGKFDGKNLKVEFSMKDSSAPKGVRKVTWTPDSDDSGNLLGTTRTLDRCDGVTTIEPFDKGVLSRDGWAIVDESSRHIFAEDDSDWKTWVEARDGTDRQDLYLFAYGHEYKEALGDFIKVAGRIPMPPKYTLGYWWSRYWQYSDAEFTALGKQIRDLGIPIDIMVIDMDWHETWTLRIKDAPKDAFGQNIGWTGYTWQKQLFPNPSNFLQDIHNLDMKTSLNLHPASGIQPMEDCYEDFVKDYLSRTSDYDGPEGYVYGEGGYKFAGTKAASGQAGEKAPVPFRIDNRNWADAYFNSVIHPLEEQGVDFWWLDWQQWRKSRYVPELSNTFWLNRTFFDDKVRRTASEGKTAPRPLIYHRWGGLGSHRYQLGFSGDTYCTWKVLGYLPYFTSTASNVGYGYWGHDIGGHMNAKGDSGTDAEMLTRWLQFGVFTPIFKTHSTKNASLERRIWMFPDYFDAMKAAIRLRYSLSPYIYTAARVTYDTGISMCRPMYYDYPEAEEAYVWNQQYMFGDNIIAAAFDRPADKTTGLAERTWWLPEGDDWYDAATGTLIRGGSKVMGKYTIDENPYFIKAGAIIPMASPKIQNLQKEDRELYLLIAPGGGDSSASVYEDDGNTQAYKTDYATTLVTRTLSEGKAVVKVAARQGGYEGMQPTRKLRIVFDNILPPTEVKVNGKEVPYSRFAREGYWMYDGSELAATVMLEETSCSEDVVIECTYPQDRTVLEGKKAVIRRMFALTPEAKLLFSSCVDAFMMLPTDFLKAAQCASLINENPSETASYLSAIDIEAMYNSVACHEQIPEEFKAKVKAQGERVYSPAE